jgi:hypothetical protein
MKAGRDSRVGTSQFNAFLNNPIPMAKTSFQLENPPLVSLIPNQYQTVSTVRPEAAVR